MNSFEESDEEKAEKLNKKAERDPEKAKSNINEMVELLKSDEKEACAYAARALRLIGGKHPELVELHIDEIAKLLNDSNGWARGKAADALEQIGEWGQSLSASSLDSSIFLWKRSLIFSGFSHHLLLARPMLPTLIMRIPIALHKFRVSPK